MGDADVRKLTGRQPPFLEQHGFSAVLWDWDGVLVDSGYNFYRAYEMVFRDEGIVTSPREIYLREGEPTPRLLKAIFDRHRRERERLRAVTLDLEASYEEACRVLRIS